MAYQTLYRAHRPQTFDQVLGQDHVIRTLKNAISRGRLAHAYLFSGPRGTGKTSTAKILAKALNCEHGPTPEPCDECSLCVRIREGYCLDVLEMDAASNRGIDEIRSLRDQIGLTPTEGRYKVYIIDEVHMLTTEAFNAFLKTLEEPPANVVFVLATTEPERIPATILSRCQRFDFRRPTPELIADHLLNVAQTEELTLEPHTALLLARSAEGSLRDALGLLDQCISYSGSDISHDEALELLGVPASESLTQILGAAGQADPGQVLALLGDLRAQGHDPHLLFKHLLLWLRNLLLLAICREPESLMSLGPAELAALKEQVGLFSPARLTAALADLSEKESQFRFAAEPWIILEAALVGLSLAGSAPAPDRPAASPSAKAPAAEPVADADKDAVQPLSTPPKAADPAPAAPVAPAELATPAPEQPVDDPASDPEEAATPGEITLQAIVDAWPDVLQQIRTRGPALEAVWRYGSPEDLSGHVLTVIFGAVGIRNVATQPDKKEAAQDALREIFGADIVVVPDVLKEPLPPRPAKAEGQPEGEGASEPPGIAQAKALFGADKVVIRQLDEE